ncbi:hypothetical protein NQ315_006309 [Exocentrus adspersus]|uniref:Centrosome-associated protein 350 n=1 Tax=Exocentrus adspersus TaxID=1586481 RepID=A0AAV8VZS4_9CUCU|nr:hypothetical protein NQ315_006309 [Exocentrus adspersus]
MDKSTKKYEISQRILETRKQTEELKAQLQSLIDAGINPSSTHKLETRALTDKENVKESENKVQIIKSYDAAHSQHVPKLGTAKVKPSESQKTEKDASPKKTRHYDVSKARAFIKEQREKRLEQQRLQNEEKKKADLKKQKLQELQKKSLELVTKNVQAKRQRSKSREHTKDFVRPVRDVPTTRSRSSSRERDGRATNLTAGKRSKSVEGCNVQVGEQETRDPNLLYPPVPHYMLHQISPTVRSKISIISGNSSDISPKDCAKLLKPKKFFKTEMEPVTSTRAPCTEKKSEEKCNSPDAPNEIVIISGNCSNEKPQSATAKDKFVTNILEYKSSHDKYVCDTRLSTSRIEADSDDKSKVATDALKKVTRETQTNSELKQDFPAWLQERRLEPDPLNFINCVRRKLQDAINSPKVTVDIGVQSSFAQPLASKSMGILQNSAKSSGSTRKSELKSFLSHKPLDLDQKTIDHIELIPKTHNLDVESESDTSKNIPEISSESGASLKRNADSVKQNGNVGLDMERLNLMKLRPHGNSNTHTVLSDRKVEATKSLNGTASGEKLYTSDFYSGSRSVTAPNKATFSSADKHVNYDILTDPKVSLKHSSDINQAVEKHSRSRSITVRSTSLVQGVSKQSNKPASSIEDPKTVPSTNISTEYESDASKYRSDGGAARSSSKSDKYKSLGSDLHSSSIDTSSDSSQRNVTVGRGSGATSRSNRLLDVPPLKESTLSLSVANGTLKKAEGVSNRVLQSVSLRPERNKFQESNTTANSNEIHLKFEAEIHLLNDFNESLRQLSEVEKAFNSLKSRNENATTTRKLLHNRDTQTSKSSISEHVPSEISTVNYSRGFQVDADSSSLNFDVSVSKLELEETNNEQTSAKEDIPSLDITNFENLQSHNFAGMTMRMFEQLIKDEDVRLENLKTILKIREQALLDRTKGELAWLEIQRKHLRETGKLHEASLIKKKQRGILLNHQKERHEMQRLKQMQKAQSVERKTILKEQRNLIKHQLCTDRMLAKIKVTTSQERRLSGPLKVIQSHTESVKSETSFSRRSSSDKEKEVYSITSHTQSIVSMVSEVSGEDAAVKDVASMDVSADLVSKLAGEACGVPISKMKRTLLMREAALHKRRKAAEGLLQWHTQLLEEEKRIRELESTANTVISQIPNISDVDARAKYQFTGRQLNQLWFNLTGCDKKFNPSKIYPMSQIALERFCKSAREYSIKKKKAPSDADSVTETFPDAVDANVASLRSATTANDYTSDFEVESIQEVVSAEDMDVIDQLIDNFSKIQSDISSLGIKSLRSGVDLEAPEESLRSDSDVEVSVIEGTQFRSKDASSKALSTSQDDLIRSEEKVSSVEEQIVAETEENSLEMEGRDNLNKSQEILEELIQLESQGSVPSKQTTIEDVQVSDNLVKSEEILLRLTQSCEKSSTASADSANEAECKDSRSDASISFDLQQQQQQDEGILTDIEEKEETVHEGNTQSSSEGAVEEVSAMQPMLNSAIDGEIPDKVVSLALEDKLIDCDGSKSQEDQVQTDAITSQDDSGTNDVLIKSEDVPSSINEKVSVEDAPESCKHTEIEEVLSDVRDEEASSTTGNIKSSVLVKEKGDESHENETCPVPKLEQMSEVELDASQKTSSEVPTPSPEHLVGLSKEDINSYEEKELDSTSLPATEKSTSDKSLKSGAVDVKKRVSEIMADASQGSRGDKSPKLQDLYTTTYDLASPTSSPELGSPTEEYKLMTAKNIYGTEAEEILRKQLAIEQEIKQITEQQQKEQLPYLFVREIPNKPPPPYTPPSSTPAASSTTIIPTREEIEDITKYSAKILHKAYLSNNLDNISISETTLSLISKSISKECYKFVFDLCKELSTEHYKQFQKEECAAWLQARKNPKLAVTKPLDVTGLENHLCKKLKELFAYEKPTRRENAIIKWSRKKRDHVDEILVLESQAEEMQWTNYDKDELLVINDVTNDIMNMLLKETGQVLNSVLSKLT